MIFKLYIKVTERFLYVGNKFKATVSTYQKVNYFSICLNRTNLVQCAIKMHFEPTKSVKGIYFLLNK